MRAKFVDFNLINVTAINHLEYLVQSWAPSGQRIGSEWVTLNPRRNDKKLGSFKINLNTGKWADFSIGKSGSDPISLYAYLFGLKQFQAAKILANILGVKNV